MEPNSLYVGNLADNVTQKDLKQLCQSNGISPATIKVVEDKYKNSKGYGYINFLTEADALKCFKSINNNNLKGK